ncbi:hypothetical protein PI126_g15814 [Phytophthora idaei]|nr:hypothetical protein PI126_g15814 [Phytophthora idaei]
MGRKGQLADYERGQTDPALPKGQRQAAIGRSRKPIANYLRDPATYGKRFGPDNPRKMSSRDCRRVVGATRQNTLSSAGLKEPLELTTSSRTVCHLLNATELFKYVKMNKASEADRRTARSSSSGTKSWSHVK